MMLNCISADMYRLMRRMPRWILLLVLVAIDFLVFNSSGDGEDTVIEVINIFGNALKYTPPLIGFIEMIYVYGDDFAGKTAQIAIGIGIKRRQIVLCKWLDVVMLSVFDVLLLSIVGLVMITVNVGTIPASMYGTIAIEMVMAVFSVGVYIALVMPLLYFSQGITLSLILYLLFSFGLINKLLGYISELKFLQKIHITTYTLTTNVNVFRTRLLLGTVHIGSICAILIYLILCFMITNMIYQKKELEF